MDLEWSQDNLQIFTAGADKQIVAWDTTSVSRRRAYKGHEDHVNALHLLDENGIVSAGDDCTIRLWDHRLKKQTMSFNVGYQVLALAHCAGQVFFGGVENTVRSLDLRKNQLDLCLVGHADSVTGLAVAPGGNFLLSNSMDNSLVIWDIKPFTTNETRLVKVLHGATHNFEKNLLRCAWSPDKLWVTAGSADRTVNVWHVESGQLRHRLGGHLGSVNETALHGNLVASSSSDKTVIVGSLV